MIPLRGARHKPQNDSRPSVAVLMSNVDDARQLKLVRALRRHGYTPTVLGFVREDYYRADSASTADIPVLGVLAHESFLSRVPVYLHSLSRLRRSLAGADMIIAFSSDHVLLVRLATALRRPVPFIVREFGDVPRAVDGSGLRPLIARIIERWGLRLTAAAVVTAEEFAWGYLRPRMNYSGALFLLPNKPDLPRPPDRDWSPPEEGRLRVLYPGLLRCRRSIEILLELAEAAPDRISVTVSGHDLTGRKIDEQTNLRFTGPFRSPDDLQALYGGCHVVYSGYPYEPDRTNYSLARTIRYRDSVVFGRPQIAHEGTADAIEVSKHEIGIIIDPSDVTAAAARIASVPLESWRQYAANARHLAEEWSTYDEDFVEIFGKLERLVTDRG